ncbi:MAG: serine/threonine-protein phosphatase [Anaerolineae bacterium]|nr:serine/threonine-protein phosphatase [Anaerolineae bacterium]
MSQITGPDTECSALTDIGPVREENQDSFRLPEDHLAREHGFLYGVADGMGGYSNGGLASTLALEKLFQTFYSESASPDKLLRRGVEAANLSIYQTAQRLGGGCMGTTLTAAHVSGDTLSLAHVGDSRAYLIRKNHATCLTADHTTVGELVRMKALTPDKVRNHDQRSVLTRCLGLSLFVQPDLARFRLQNKDYVILCSDGLWSVIQDEEIAQITCDLRNAEAISQTLISLALARQTDDNASVVVIDIRHVVPSQPDDTQKWWPFSLKGRDNDRAVGG